MKIICYYRKQVGIRSRRIKIIMITIGIKWTAAPREIKVFKIGIRFNKVKIAAWIMGVMGFIKVYG